MLIMLLVVVFVLMMLLTLCSAVTGAILECWRRCTAERPDPEPVPIDPPLDEEEVPPMIRELRRRRAQRAAFEERLKRL